MATLNFPTFSRPPSTIEWGLQSLTRVHQSPLTGAMRTISTPGARWKFTAVWRAFDGTDRRTAEAFLAQLNGMAGRFYYSPPEYRRPRGTATAANVNGGSQTGSTLNVYGMGAGATLLIGDFFQVGNELKRMTANVTADGGGLASLPFAPPLRASPTTNAALVFSSPKTTFMLTDDSQTIVIGAGGFADFTLSAIEAFV